jgi:hypothetical protein
MNDNKATKIIKSFKHYIESARKYLTQKGVKLPRKKFVKTTAIPPRV